MIMRIGKADSNLDGICEEFGTRFEKFTSKFSNIRLDLGLRHFCLSKLNDVGRITFPNMAGKVKN